MAMCKAIIFGGTTEGRALCKTCAARGVPALYCVATEVGARPVAGLGHVGVRVGRLAAGEMAALLEMHRPALVLDATHPYAAQASANIAAACARVGATLLRVAREAAWEEGCVLFESGDSLLAWLEDEKGSIFVTTGASYAGLFARLRNYQSRVWMRVLPSADSLKACLALGFAPL